MVSEIFRLQLVLIIFYVYFRFKDNLFSEIWPNFCWHSAMSVFKLPKSPSRVFILVMRSKLILQHRVRHSITHLTLSSSETSRSGGLGSGGLDQPGLPASPSTARSHRRMASAPHVPRRTVSRLTSNNSSSTENSNVNLNNNNSVKLQNSNQHQSSPSRRVLTGGQISGGLGGSSAVTSATSITSTGTAPVSSSSNAVAAGN